MPRYLIAAATVRTGQGHDLQPGAVLAETDADDPREELEQLSAGRLHARHVDGGFLLVDAAQRADRDAPTRARFRSPLEPPIDPGTLLSMLRRRQAEETDQPPADDPDDNAGDDAKPTGRRRHKAAGK